MPFAFDDAAFDDAAFDADAPDVILVARIDQTAITFEPTVDGIYAIAVLEDAPIAYWTLGETSGEFLDREVGNNGFASSGAVTRGVAGINVDGAITVNNDGRVTIPDSPDMDFTTPFSIEMWVKRSSLNSLDNALWGKGSGGVPYVFVTGSSQSPSGRVTLAKSDTADVVQTDARITDTNWHHIVVTYSHNVEAKIYVDGVNRGGTPTYHGFNANSTAAAIGSKTGAAMDSGWRGSIDEVAIYNYVLTQDQVSFHYALGTGARVARVGQINQTAVLFEPRIDPVTFFPNQINQTAVAHNPLLTYNQDRAVDFIDQTAVAYEPRIAFVIGPGLIDQTATVHTPTIAADGSIALQLGRINRTGHVFAPSLDRTGYFPEIVDPDTQTGVVSVDSTSWTLTYPTNLVSGDLIIAMLAIDGTAGITTMPAGWVFLSTNSASAIAGAWAKKLSNGTETGNIAVTLNGAQQGAWRVIRIPAGTWEGTLGTGFGNSFSSDGSVVRGGAAANLNTTPSAVSLDPFNWAAENTLWLNFGSADTALEVTGFPTDYTGTLGVEHGYLASEYPIPGATLFWGERRLNASSEDPGDFTLSTTAWWIAHTIAVRGNFDLEINLGLIDQTAVAYAPQNVGIETQDIFFALISNPATTFTPSVEWEKLVFIDRINRAALPFNPTITGGYEATIPPDIVPATVVIRYDGTNITDDVVIVGATFTSQVNGTPGTCEFRVKDPDHTYSLTVGKRLTLDINGERVWTGYVSKVSRVYAFPAMDTSNPSEVTRFLRVDGVDINILFRKRVVFEKARPKRLDGRTYTTDNTDDTVAYFDLIEDFLDLSGDNLDTSSMIENVGTINVDHPSNPIAPGHPWGDSMRSIIALSNGVFYIDPDRRVVLTDVDTPSAPFDLSDDPADNAVGYREMEVLYNASNMINDCIVWGAGAGSGTMVYSRETDATSVSTHGRWQYGEFRGDMYKQGTVNRRADSIVQGSAQSKRGAKDDQVTVMCSVFTPGLRVSQKVDFTSATFGFQDVLPIRRMTVSFIGPTQPKYQITAGHEIDMPYGVFDLWRPKISFGGIPDIDIDEIPGPEIDIPDLDGDCQCDDEICGITDTFSRTVTEAADDEAGFPTAWGTSDSGAAWLLEPGSMGGTSFAGVSDGAGYFRNGAGGSEDAFATLPIQPPSSFTLTCRFRLSAIPAVTSTGIDLFVRNGSVGFNVGVNITSNVSTGEFYLNVPGSIPSLSKTDWVADTWYTMKFAIADGEHVTGKIWEDENDPEPDWMLETTTNVTSAGLPEPIVQLFDVQFGQQLDIDSIDFGVNSCSNYRFDDFNRTVAFGPSGWGTTSSGYDWIGEAEMQVNGQWGQFVKGPASVSTIRSAWIESQVGDSLPWNEPIFTMTSRFKLDTIHTQADTYNYIGYHFYDNDIPGSTREYHSVAFQIANHGGGGGGVIYFNDTSVGTKTDWVADAWYMVKYECEPGVQHRFKFWLESDGEPGSWFAEEDDTGNRLLTNDVLTFFEVEVANRNSANPTNTPANTISFDYIDFDYDGKPCNGSNSETLKVLDDFGRSIAVHAPLDPTETGSWGITSGTSDPWYHNANSSPLPAAFQVWYGVDNGEGIVRYIHNGTGSTFPDFVMTLNEGGSDLFPYFIEGDGVPDELYPASNDVTWAIDFMLTTEHMAAQDPYLEFDWADRVDRDIDGILVWFDFNDNQIAMDTFLTGTVTYDVPAWERLQWYTLMVQRQPGWARAKVFRRGDTEPAWQVSRTLDPTVWEAGEFTMWGQHGPVSGTPTESDFRFSNFRIVGPPCGVETTTVPASGRVCEEFIGDGVTTDFFTVQTQTYGQTSVTIDGFHQTLQQYDQIANDDGNLTGVSLLVAPAVDEVVRVCYNVGEGINAGSTTL